jgi:hypothetical protein
MPRSVTPLLVLAFACTRERAPDELLRARSIPATPAAESPTSSDTTVVERCLTAGERHGNLDSLEQRLGPRPSLSVREVNDSVSGVNGQLITHSWPGLEFKVFRRSDGYELRVGLTVFRPVEWIDCDIVPGTLVSTAQQVLGTPAWTHSVAFDTTLWGYEDLPERPGLQLRMYRDTVLAVGWVYVVD